MNNRSLEIQWKMVSQRRVRQLLTSFGRIGLLITLIGTFMIQVKKYDDKKMRNESTEGYLLQNVSTTPIDPKFRPVLIYRYRGTNRPAFTGVGTLFGGTNGPLIATVEHLLQRKFANELFVLRYLSPDEHQITNGIRSIAYRNIDAGLPNDSDVVFVRPGDPKLIECYSGRSDSVPEMTKVYYFDDVTISGRVIKSLKSLVTGKEYMVIGGAKTPQFILIDYASKAGESGSGFVDRYGQLYILSGGTRDDTNHVSFMCGPFADIGKRL